jgi:hypothetical protein
MLTAGWGPVQKPQQLFGCLESAIAAHSRAAIQAALPHITGTPQVKHERLTGWDNDTLGVGDIYDQYSDVRQIGHMLAAVPDLSAEGLRVRNRLLCCRQTSDAAHLVLQDPYFTRP